jgi:hypothetical protein
MITEFKCRISQVVIDDLKFKIAQTRWTDEIKNSGWEYGANLSYIRELTDYWLNKFDWRKVENEINQYPNYTVHRINLCKRNFAADLPSAGRFADKK